MREAIGAAFDKGVFVLEQVLHEGQIERRLPDASFGVRLDRSRRGGCPVRAVAPYLEDQTALRFTQLVES